MTPPNKPDDSEGGFLGRWSRRKLKPEPEMPVVVPAPHPATPAEPDNRPRDPETGEVIDEELVSSLPKVEDLQAGGDLSGFMQKGVPEALRREALRTMWLADPMIRNYVSPALDYAYDYNVPGGAPGHGPLTESDMAQAREFLANVFSTPPDPSQAQESAQESGTRDNESHIVTETATVAVRQSDAAPQHGQHLALASDIGDSVAEPHDAFELPQTSDGVVVQRSIDPMSSVVTPPTRKRRGGGAAPV